ncbi:MAG: P27 family phage terminase small subunit [Patulibacter sp.]
MADQLGAAALSKLSKAQLVQRATAAGIESAGRLTKAAIVEQLAPGDTAFKRPAGLSAHGRAAWQAAYDEIAARGPLRAADAFALERYARACAVARQCWEQVGSDLTATGSMGQPVTDPLVDSALKAEKAAEAFAKALGIEVAARIEKNRGGRPQTRNPMLAAGDIAATSRTRGEPPVLTMLPAAR